MHAPTPNKTLFITAFHPAGQGFIGAGEAISEQHLRFIADQGSQIHVISLAPTYQVASQEIIALVETYDTLPQSTMKALSALLSCLSMGSWLAPWFFTRVSPENVQFIREAIKKHGITHIHLDFPSCLGFVSVFAHLSIGYSLHDVVTQKIERKSLLKFLAVPISRIESHLLSQVEYCIALSAKDASKVKTIGYQGIVEVLLPWKPRIGLVDNGTPVVDILAQFGNVPNIVFFGNMQREENHKSIMQFLLSSYSKIRHQHPDIQCWIMGLSPRWSLRMMARLMPGLHVTGAVDDPTPAFQQAALCIAPVYYGAGVKIKVLQMLDSGATVVATTIGAEGIEPNERLLIADGDQFAIVVNRMLSIS